MKDRSLCKPLSIKTVPFDQIYFFCVAMVCFVLAILSIFMLTPVFFHSDTAATSLLAQSQIHEGSLYPQDWIYGQDIPIFSNGIIIALLFWFMHDQILIYSTSVLIVAIIFFFIFYYFCKISFSKKVFWFMVSFLLGGLIFSSLGGSASDAWLFDMLLIHQGYLIHFLYILVAFILFFLAFDEHFFIQSKLAFWILLAFLIFVNLQSVRFLANLTLPLLISIFSLFLLFHYKEEKETVLAALRPFLKCFFFIAAFSIIGYLLSRVIKQNVSYFVGVNDAAYAANQNIFANLPQFFSDIAFLFGFKLGVPLFSLQSIKNFLAIVFSFVFVFLFPTLLLLKFKQQSFPVKILLLFNLSGFMITFFLYLFISDLNLSRYLIPNIILSVFLGLYYTYQYLFKKSFLLKSTTVILISVFLILGIQTTISHLKNSGEAAAAGYELSNYLESAGLSYGYASYWNAGLNTILSNDSVIISGVGFATGIPAPFYVLTPKSAYLSSSYDGSTFLMFTEKELKSIDLPKLNKLLGSPVEIKEITAKATPSATPSGEEIRYYIYVYDFNVAQKLPAFPMEVGQQKALLYGMSGSDRVVFENDFLLVPSGELIYGPYGRYAAGSYRLDLSLDISGAATSNLSTSPMLKITADDGRTLLGQYDLKLGTQQISFDLDREYGQVEFVISNSFDTTVAISGLTLHYISGK